MNESPKVSLTTDSQSVSRYTTVVLLSCINVQNTSECDIAPSFVHVFVFIPIILFVVVAVGYLSLSKKY